MIVGGGFVAVGHAQFRKQMTQMKFDGAFAQMEFGGNLGVALAFGHLRPYHFFARGGRVRVGWPKISVGQPRTGTGELSLMITKLVMKYGRQAWT